MDTQLKERIVGIVVVLALVVIFLPSLLHQPDIEYAQIRIPEKPDLSRVKKFHQVEPLAPKFEFETTEKEIDEKVNQVITEAADVKAKRADKSKEATAKSPWAIQVARFEQVKNAESLQKRLVAAGFLAEVNTLRGSKLPFQVLVEPKAPISTYEMLQKALMEKMNLKGILFRRS